jgi:aspartate aminotransferase-like enzyme
MARKGYLMTPGPTPIPPEVEAAMAQPIVYHRGPDFRPILERVLGRLPEVFRTRGVVVLLTGTGTSAMESAVANLCTPGERALVVSAGSFGERFGQIAARYGFEVEALRYAWGETPDPGDVRAKLVEMGGARAVFCTHCETSTGVVADVEAIAVAAREAGALCVVDAISSLAAVPLEQDAWGIDVVVSGSQKGLMTPPGLGFVSVSEPALAAAAGAAAPRFTLDWERALRAQADGNTPFTTAVSLVRGLDAALELLLRTPVRAGHAPPLHRAMGGLEAAWERAAELGRQCRAGVKALGLELFSPDEDRCAVVTVVRVPDGVDGRALVRSMRERSGVTVAGGQGELAGKIIRIGHVGYIDREDVAAALEALQRALAEAGVPVPATPAT